MNRSTKKPAEAPAEAYVIACLVQGAWKRAVHAIHELGMSPQYAPHLATASNRFLMARNLDAANELAQLAVDSDPCCAAAHEALAAVSAARGDRPGAIRAFLAAADCDPANISARIALARLNVAQGEPGSALGPMAEVMAAAPWSDTVKSTLKEVRKACESSYGKEDSRSKLARDLVSRCFQAGSSWRQATLSLCMITKNEAHNIARVIRSAQGVATEVIVVDTGSSDDTVKTARRYGAKVFEMEWTDDFAAARNESLSHATGEWILVMDADDELMRDSVPALQSWLRRPSDFDVVGLYRRYPYPGMQAEGVTIQPRLFRNGKGIRFSGAIHEQVTCSDGTPATPGTVLTCSIFHHGAVEGENALERRHTRNLRILTKAVSADPTDMLAAMYAGLTTYEMGDWTEAVRHFGSVIRIADSSAEYLPKAYACLANATLMCSRPDVAESIARKGLDSFPEYPELWFCLGLILNKVGRLEEAIEAHKRALKGRFGTSLNWHDWACRDLKPNVALSDLYLSFGETDNASACIDASESITGPLPVYDQIRLAISQTEGEKERERSRRESETVRLREEFDAGESFSGVALVESLISLGLTTDALEFTDRWLAGDTEGSEALLARGRVLLALGDENEALRCLDRAAEALPHSPSVWLSLADANTLNGRVADARHCLERAAELGDPRAALRLGERMMTEDNWSDAERWFRRSLEGSAEEWRAWLGLGTAKLRLGKTQEAIQSFRQAASISGGGADVRKALGQATAYLTRRAA